MKELLPNIQACPLFEGIEDNDLQGLLGCLGARVLHVKKGQIIFYEGESPFFLGIVLAGSAKLVREDFYGNRSIVAHIGPTQLFGESYAFSGANSLPVSVVVDEDGAYLLLDSRRITGCCSNACNHHNRVIYNLLRLAATKNLMLHQKMQITSQRTTRDKLMTYLLNQAKQIGCSSFTIPYDRQGLADYLEVDRSGLSTEIGKLRKEGVLECRKSTFRLLIKEHDS